MCTVLIIDDNPQNADLLDSYMRLYDIKTVVAYTGQEGFEFAKNIQPNLIFTDLRMPLETWDGYKTISMLKSSPATQHIPIIAVTASGDLLQAKDAGCDNVLLRPFRTSQLKDILDQYITVT